ncbi:hypothetical protein KEM48_007831 [Puccinia striiformis f. sp. tritici PST-130]|nr:hypothetical protein KEM48_007831 [Puccinia striiformis f. sp. tritici PST-130]
MPHGLPALQNTSTIHPTTKEQPTTIIHFDFPCSHSPSHSTSPLIRPSKLMYHSLTRANSLPDKPQRPITARSVTTSSPRVNPPPKPSLSIKRTQTSPGPTRARLPTSPKPASAVTVASGLTVSVEWLSTNPIILVEGLLPSPYNTSGIKKILMAFFSTFPNERKKGRPFREFLKQLVNQVAEDRDIMITKRVVEDLVQVTQPVVEEKMNERVQRTPSRSQEGFRRSHRSGGRTTPSSTPPTPTVIVLSSSSSRPQNDNDETKTDQRRRRWIPFRYTYNNCHLHPPPPPGSQASGYISFASLNLFAPPSPPESCAGGFLADDEQEIIHSDALMIHPKPIRLKLPHSSRT